MAPLQVVRAAGYTAAPWKNGAGTTREVARDLPAPPDGSFRWRVSIADVATDGPFSVFPGIDRILTLIEPAGVLLTVDGVEHNLNYLDPFSFPGDAATTAQLTAGVTRDLNVMTSRRSTRATVDIVALGVAATVTQGPAETVLVVVVAGAAMVTADATSARLGPLDSLFVGAVGPVTLTAAEPKASVAVIRLVPR
jgi:hypothetical protein